MSNRGFIVTNLQTRRTIVAESASCIPLCWLSFLSMEEIDQLDNDGTIVLDRKRAIKRGSDNLPFLSTMFPHVPDFTTFADSLIKKVESEKSKTIGIDLEQLLPAADEEMATAMPNLRTAIEAIENRSANHSQTVPGRDVENPFTKERTKLTERRFTSTCDMLLFVCSIFPESLNSKESAVVREAIVGHVWD